MPENSTRVSRVESGLIACGLSESGIAYKGEETSETQEVMQGILRKGLVICSFDQIHPHSVGLDLGREYVRGSRLKNRGGILVH